MFSIWLWRSVIWPRRDAADSTLRSLDQAAWHPVVVATLVFVASEQQILLIRKKRGHGAGKINGPGGKVEPGESPYACAIRECQEEIGITPIWMEPIVELHFVEANATGVSDADAGSMQAAVDSGDMLGYAFRATDFTGKLVETDEAEPFWFPLDAVPYTRMWADDRIWLPRLIARRHCLAEFLMDGERVVDHRISTMAPADLDRLVNTPVP